MVACLCHIYMLMNKLEQNLGNSFTFKMIGKLFHVNYTHDLLEISMKCLWKSYGMNTFSRNIIILKSCCFTMLNMWNIVCFIFLTSTSKVCFLLLCANGLANLRLRKSDNWKFQIFILGLKFGENWCILF